MQDSGTCRSCQGSVTLPVQCLPVRQRHTERSQPPSTPRTQQQVEPFRGMTKTCPNLSPTRD